MLDGQGEHERGMTGLLPGTLTLPELNNKLRRSLLLLKNSGSGRGPGGEKQKNALTFTPTQAGNHVISMPMSFPVSVVTSCDVRIK